MSCDSPVVVLVGTYDSRATDVSAINVKANRAKSAGRRNRRSNTVSSITKVEVADVGFTLNPQSWLVFWLFLLILPQFCVKRESLHKHCQHYMVELGEMTRLILDRTPAAPYSPPNLDADQVRVVNHRQGDDGAAKEVGVEVEEGGRHPRMLGQERRDAVLKPPRIQFHFCRLVRYFSA